MAAEDIVEAFNRQVRDIISSMENEGMVDHLFGRVYSMKGSNGPFFLVSLLPNFCRDSTTTLRDLMVALDQPVLNHHQLNQLCIKVEGSSCSIGASRFASACSEIRRVIEAEPESKERHMAALDVAKRELMLFQRKMDAIVQLETMIAYEIGRRLP